MRYKMFLSYNGAPFCGWQRQNGAPSVQQSLEEALSTLLRVQTGVTGAGRTDTGVNACAYTAHFDASASLDTAQFCCKLNAILPPAIKVHGIEPAADDFHARFDAAEREYTYFLHRVKDPFIAGRSYLCGYPVLDFEAMNRAAQALLGTHDFACFAKTGSDVKTTVCTLSEACWYPYEPDHVRLGGYPAGMDGVGPGDYYYFRIRGDRFLRNMVRAIVGTLIEVGRGKRSAGSMAALLESGDRCSAGESVPGHALFLTGIKY
ncbi:MAG: tRNA pseudouridine(38-40) synthase TruA [Bacteroidales bacterium]|nr:tRNA pseudouridine(38-40) synthase TruA [Bacteroidales bacterium]